MLFPSVPRDNDTALSLAKVIVTEYKLYGLILLIIYIKKAKCKIKNYNRSKPEIIPEIILSNI